MARAPGGHLLIEPSERQAARTMEAVALGVLVPRLASSDELNATVVIERGDWSTCGGKA